MHIEQLVRRFRKKPNQMPNALRLRATAKSVQVAAVAPTPTSHLLRHAVPRSYCNIPITRSQVWHAIACCSISCVRCVRGWKFRLTRRQSFICNSARARRGGSVGVWGFARRPKPCYVKRLTNTWLIDRPLLRDHCMVIWLQIKCAWYSAVRKQCRFKANRKMELTVYRSVDDVQSIVLAVEVIRPLSVMPHKPFILKTESKTTGGSRRVHVNNTERSCTDNETRIVTRHKMILRRPM